MNENDAQFYRDTESIAFPKLDDRQLALLEPLGQRRALRRGEFIFKAGQRDFGMTVVLNGELEVYETRDGLEQILATPGPRDFVGDVAMLTGTSALASARGKAEVSEILVVGAVELRKALAELHGLRGCSGTANSLDSGLSRRRDAARDIKSTTSWIRITFRTGLSNLRAKTATACANT